jgi:hypothetical protein
MRRSVFSVPVVLLGTLVFQDVRATEYSYDLTTCFQGTITMVSTNEDMTVYGIEADGISRSESNKEFDGNTAHCVGIGKAGADGSIRQGYCKYLQPNGDVVVGGFKQVNKEKGVWTYLHGTGGFAGIAGGGTYEIVVRGKPLRPGTYSSCNRATGKYTLP